MTDQPRRRRIAVVTSSRADAGHLHWVLKELATAADVELRVIATAAHLAPGFGRSVEVFAETGIRVDDTIEALLDSDTDVGMAKTIGVAILGLGDLLGRLRPDLILLIADRYEMLAPAATALALRIPIAHIEGGEISAGAIDDAVRNAITKLAHLHFVSTHAAMRRVRAMGEEPWRIHRAGAPSLDHLHRSPRPDRAAVERALGRSLPRPPIVVSCHPVTLDADPSAEAVATFASLADADCPLVFCFPNADVGHTRIIAAAQAICRTRSDATLHVNLDPVSYWGLLRHAAAIVGNSSSGIMESPSLALPCVNVGRRQEGRERARNVIDVAAERAAVKAAVGRALSADFAESLVGMTNPYGDGDAARRIAATLREVPLAGLLHKRALPVTDIDPPAFVHDQQP